MTALENPVPTYRDAVPTTRDRLLDAAQHLVETQGWSKVTMSRIAELVGVSRQTVHNELGTKHTLAQALALRELDRFLEVVRSRMAAEADLVAGVRAACQGVLELGEQSLLVRTIVTSVRVDGTGEQDGDLLAILTTESGEIVAASSAVVKQSLVDHFSPLPLADDELDVAVEVVVRLVLSCITRPSKPPAEAADDIAWFLRLALAGKG
ncbi:TetR family transcriptional regulator [Aeromicrobium sp. CTD01-1L150]|uniref:TetR family transcriptional regulator n=1 Tax=Aeromicrobium sp. CTD01-1L150 TaxID=3341830 RepID=UPI0035C128DE